MFTQIYEYAAREEFKAIRSRYVLWSGTSYGRSAYYGNSGGRSCFLETISNRLYEKSIVLLLDARSSQVSSIFLFLNFK